MDERCLSNISCITQIPKRIFPATARFLVGCTSRKLRQRIYSIPFIGHYLQNALRSILYAILCTDDFQWFKFKSGHRAGLEMKLKLPEESEFHLETHDPEVTVLLCKNIQPGFTVVDVGAHIGYFTMLISRLAGPEGKVFALEPLPKNVIRLEEHLFRNHCSQNTKVLPLALAEYDGKEQFLYFDFSTIGRFSSIESEVKDKPSGDITVECRTLDSLIQDNSILSPDFVKIDVEGAELRVLQGMENLFKVSRPKLLIEFHNKKVFKEIMEFLENRGYRADVNEKTLDNLTSPQATLIGVNILFTDCQKFKNDKCLI